MAQKLYQQDGRLSFIKSWRRGNTRLCKKWKICNNILSPKETVQGFITGDYGSDIDIAVVHPDSIGVQNPYDQLEYEDLPETP